MTVLYFKKVLLVVKHLISKGMCIFRAIPTVYTKSPTVLSDQFSYN